MNMGPRRIFCSGASLKRPLEAQKRPPKIDHLLNFRKRSKPKKGPPHKDEKKSPHIVKGVAERPPDGEKNLPKGEKRTKNGLQALKSIAKRLLHVEKIAKRLHIWRKALQKGYNIENK